MEIIHPELYVLRCGHGKMCDADEDEAQRKHMMTSSNGNIFRLTDPLCGESTGPRWIPRTKAIDADLRHHRAHYDVIVMELKT